MKIKNLNNGFRFIQGRYATSLKKAGLQFVNHEVAKLKSWILKLKKTKDLYMQYLKPKSD